MRAPTLDSVHDALVGRGFRQAAIQGALAYDGEVQVGSDPVLVQLEITDPELQRLPIIRLRDRPAWVPANCNHVDPHNVICYVNPRLASIDRYRADSQVLYCIDRATDVLRDIRRGNVRRDVDQEFAYYWKGRSVLVDADTSDTAEWLDVIPMQIGGSERFIIVNRGEDGRRKYAAFAPAAQSPLSARIIPGGQTPAADPRKWPPETLQDVIAWLKQSDPTLLKAFRKAIGQLNGRCNDRSMFLFQTEPAWFGVGFARPKWIPVKFRSDREFVNAIEKRSATVQVDRWTPVRVDSRYLVERNLRDGEQSLLGKRILLAGCGAIGGHLAHALARAGAGFESGLIVLADPEHLLGGNVGRHRLGVGSLLLPKADALQQDLSAAMPGINVFARQASALDLPLREFDLVVDATGEEQLSEALNTRFLAGECPPLVFAWIIGNGLAVQSFTLASREQGCLRCWKSHGDRSSFAPADIDSLEARVGRGCDDPYVPFNGAAPLAAASLALQATLDWVSGRPNPTLRTIELDYRVTHHVKPRTPARTPICLACGHLR